MKPTSKKQLQLEFFPSLSQPFQGEKNADRNQVAVAPSPRLFAGAWLVAQPVGVEGMWMMDGSFINKNMWI